MEAHFETSSWILIALTVAIIAAGILYVLQRWLVNKAIVKFQGWLRK